jgi:hypothetical protein
VIRQRSTRSDHREIAWQSRQRQRAHAPSNQSPQQLPESWRCEVTAKMNRITRNRQFGRENPDVAWHWAIGFT